MLVAAKAASRFRHHVENLAPDGYLLSFSPFFFLPQPLLAAPCFRTITPTSVGGYPSGSVATANEKLPAIEATNCVFHRLKLAWRDNDLHTSCRHCAGDVFRKSSIDDQDVNASQQGEMGKVVMTKFTCVSQNNAAMRRCDHRCGHRSIFKNRNG
jgi:hypothetical protein